MKDALINHFLISHQVSKCRFNESNIGAVLAGYEKGTPGDEGELEAAVASLGPISVTVDASHNSFQSYESGGLFHICCITKCMSFQIESLHHVLKYWSRSTHRLMPT